MSPARADDLDCRSSFINGDLTAENAENAEEDDLDCRSSFINWTINLWAPQPTPGALTRLPHLAHNENCCSPSFPQTLLNPKPPNWFRRFPRSPTLHDARLPPGEAIGHASGRIDEPSSGKPVVAGLRAAHSFDSAGDRTSRLEKMATPEASQMVGRGHMNLWILWREGSLAR